MGREESRELRKLAVDRGKSGDLGRWEEEEFENGILGFWGTGRARGGW